MKDRKVSRYKKRRATMFARVGVLTERKNRWKPSLVEATKLSPQREELSGMHSLSLIELLSISSILDAKIAGVTVVEKPTSISAQRQLGRILRRCGEDKEKLTQHQNRVNRIIMRKNSIENSPSESNREKYRKILEEFDS